MASLVAASFAMSQRGAHAAGAAVISVSPATATANVGDDVPLDIDAANVTAAPGIGGYVIALQWNPAVLALTSIADAGWVTGSKSVFVWCTTPTIDNTAGKAEYDCNPLMAFGSGVTTSGPQALAHAVFHAKAPGTTAIDLSGSTLQNPSNISTSSTLTNGSVTVAEAATATASAAATSTSTPQPTSTVTVVSATDTPVPTPTPAPVSQTPSTKPTQETLSKVDVPQTGSGTPDGSGTAWGIPALVAAGAALLGIGGLGAFRRGRSQRDGKQ